MKPATLAAHLARDLDRDKGALNPLVDRTATRIFPNLDALEHATSQGRLSAFLGSQTPDIVAEAIAQLEGAGCEALITSSGMSALTITLLGLLSNGDHVLMPHTVFGPTRVVADDLLRRMGITTSYYDALASQSELAAQFRPETRLILTESPGSNTMEVQDIPAIVATAHAAGALVAIDNSWATPILFRPLEHGVDVSICAATKYLLGHSDAILGTIAARPELLKKLRRTAQQMGDTPAPDAAWLLARGLRTLPLRLRQHEDSTNQVIRALDGHPMVRQILHPSQPDSPGHREWKRDFDGASGLFSVVTRSLDRVEQEALFAGLKLFELGFSWGGFESLILPLKPAPEHALHQTPHTLLRIHVGLEDPEDLITDLIGGLDSLSVKD